VLRSHSGWLVRCLEGGAARQEGCSLALQRAGLIGKHARARLAPCRQRLRRGGALRQHRLELGHFGGIFGGVCHPLSETRFRCFSRTLRRLKRCRRLGSRARSGCNLRFASLQPLRRQAGVSCSETCCQAPRSLRAFVSAETLATNSSAFGASSSMALPPAARKVWEERRVLL
jgi:hypothetical protein